ncbi:MAG: hypothetical protein HXY44_16130 [Syntrophaceae bacterium]|nr:hypothetical protein [Syntrophaceae bacterium]
MECEKARDQFSSLWEGELIPSEEKNIREHLASCPICQKEFERFEKMMDWLRSVEEVDLPERFLAELHKKMEERRRASQINKPREKGFVFPLSFKLPAQAVAMVAIVFLVLYLTKMMPMEVRHMKDTKPPLATFDEEKKSGEILSQKERGPEHRSVEIPPHASRPKEKQFVQAPIPEEEKPEGMLVPPIRQEAMKAEVQPHQPEIMADHQMESEEGARGRTPSPGLEKGEKELSVKEKSALASKSHLEMILKVSDREAATLKLQGLIKQFGGEIVVREENIFVASLPTALLSDFEQQWIKQGGSFQTDKMVFQKQRPEGSRSFLKKGKEEVDQKSKGQTKLESDQENRTIVRILLIQE